MSEKEPRFESQITQEKIIPTENLDRKYEVSPEFVENMENLNLNIVAKVNLLLVKAGLKPSSTIDLTIRNNENTFLTEEELKNIEFAIKNAELPYEIGEKEFETYESHELNTGRKYIDIVETIEISVARTQEELEQLKEIQKRLPSIEDVEKGNYSQEQRKLNYEALGKAYGYPPSAVEAFADTAASEEKRHKLANETHIPEEVKKSDAYIFSTFILSKDNWREEIKQGQIWADCIKSLSPKIYREMLERAKEIRELK